jgi:2-polyprenyl-3-methyl-5-hydroxy-6-metoxy-1,4-benzoquinol methylase
MDFHLIRRDRCPSCGSADGGVLRSLPFDDVRVWGFVDAYYAGRVPKDAFFGALYEIRSCDRCGLLWQSSILDETGMRLLYEHWISAEESLAKKRDAGIDLYSSYAREMEAIAGLIGRRPADITVLDFGMGWGYWCRTAQAFGYRVAGYETSRARIEHARGMGIQVIEDRADLAGRTFDFINCEQVIEHLSRPDDVLRELSRHLAPGGVIRVSVPDGKGMAERVTAPDWNASKDALHPLEHINCFTHAALRKLAEQVGLTWLTKREISADNRGTKLYFRMSANGTHRHEILTGTC